MWTKKGPRRRRYSQRSHWDEKIRRIPRVENIARIVQIRARGWVVEGLTGIFKVKVRARGWVVESLIRRVKVKVRARGWVLESLIGRVAIKRGTVEDIAPGNWK